MPTDEVKRGSTVAHIVLAEERFFVTALVYWTLRIRCPLNRGPQRRDRNRFFFTCEPSGDQVREYRMHLQSTHRRQFNGRLKTGGERLERIRRNSMFAQTIALCVAIALGTPSAAWRKQPSQAPPKGSSR